METMEKNSVLIDVIRSGQPSGRRWTPHDRITEAIFNAALLDGEDALVRELENLAASGLPEAVLASIWTVSTPQLPWTVGLLEAIAEKLAAADGDDFVILQKAIRRIDFDRPSVGEEVLRRTLSGNKRSANPILLLFALLNVAKRDPELFVLAVKNATLRQKKGRAPKNPLSIDGLLFGTLLSEVNFEAADATRFAATALVHFEDDAWRKEADPQQLVSLLRDLLGLLFVAADRATAERGAKMITGWAISLPPESRPSLILGRLITLLEEGLTWWRPWVRSFLLNLLTGIMEEDGASTWATGLRSRLEALADLPKPEITPKSPAWQRWLAGATDADLQNW